MSIRGLPAGDYNLTYDSMEKRIADSEALNFELPFTEGARLTIQRGL